MVTRRRPSLGALGGAQLHPIFPMCTECWNSWLKLLLETREHRGSTFSHHLWLFFMFPRDFLFKYDFFYNSYSSTRNIAHMLYKPLHIGLLKNLDKRRIALMIERVWEEALRIGTFPFWMFLSAWQNWIWMLLVGPNQRLDYLLKVYMQEDSLQNSHLEDIDYGINF